MYLKSASDFWPVFDKFHFLPEEYFSDVVWVGGSAGAGEGPKQPPPPPSPLSSSLSARTVPAPTVAWPTLCHAPKAPFHQRPWPGPIRVPTAAGEGHRPSPSITAAPAVDPWVCESCGTLNKTNKFKVWPCSTGPGVGAGQRFLLHNSASPALGGGVAHPPPPLGPLPPRQALDFEASSQGSRSASPRPDSPSTASTVSCSTEGSLFHPLNVACLYVTNLNHTCTHWVFRPKDLSKPNLVWPSGASDHSNTGRE